MVNWGEVPTILAATLPGEELDEYLDELAHDILVAPPASSEAAVLIQALDLARHDLTRRSIALALAVSADVGDDAAVDALVKAFRQSRTHAFLAPAFLDALAVLAVRNPIARAEVVNILVRLNGHDSRYLLVKAARVIVRLSALHSSGDLRAKLDEFRANSDLAVCAEASTQYAYLMLADALQSTSIEDLRPALKHAHEAFAHAEQLEEHRPDAALFACLLEMLLLFFDLPDNRSKVAGHMQTIEGRLRKILAASWWPGYRSESADVCVARVLAIADSLLQAAQSMEEADDWTNFDEPLTELAALYAVIKSQESSSNGFPDAGIAYERLADLLFAPRLGLVLNNAVGRRRLAKITENYVVTHGSDDVAVGLRAFVQVVTDIDRASPNDTMRRNGDKPAEISSELIHLASILGQTPEALVLNFLQARNEGMGKNWATQLGLSSDPLPIDNPLALGGNSAIHEVAMRLLREIHIHLGEYPEQKRQRLVPVIEQVISFVKYVRDTLPDYVRCQEDGGKGQTASESDLQKPLFAWLRQRFGDWAIYESGPIAGGRVDTGLVFPECRIPIEVKHEFTSIEPEHVRSNYLTQADTYASATDKISLLLILDLRASHAKAHRTAKRVARREGLISEAISLYTLDEGFWVDALSTDSQVPRARPNVVVIGIVPGNRPVPSSTTKYSTRPSAARRSTNLRRNIRKQAE